MSCGFLRRKNRKSKICGLARFPTNGFGASEHDNVAALGAEGSKAFITNASPTIWKNAPTCSGPFRSPAQGHRAVVFPVDTRAERIENNQLSPGGKCGSVGYG